MQPFLSAAVVWRRSACVAVCGMRALSCTSLRLNATGSSSSSTSSNAQVHGDSFFSESYADDAERAHAGVASSHSAETGSSGNVGSTNREAKFTSSGASSERYNKYALVKDDTVDWMHGYIDKAVDSGRQTEKSAAYFREILGDVPEFMSCMKEARRLIGDQDPEKFTKYQQGQFADRISKRVSDIASERLMRAHNEENRTKEYTQHGTPTGENYWFEAGNTLASPSVPGFIKDEILTEMQKERNPTSPAYDEPSEKEFIANDKEYSEVYRRKRMRLLRSDEN